jgi:hypothetical protein
MSQKIGNSRILILLGQTILCVRVLHNFKAVAVSSAAFLRTVYSAWRHKIRRRRAAMDQL